MNTHTFEDAHPDCRECATERLTYCAADSLRAPCRGLGGCWGHTTDTTEEE